MKNTLTLTHQTTRTPITFCCGGKAYKKYIKKEYGIKEHLSDSGRTTILTENDNISFVVAISPSSNIYVAKSLIVHELNHVVTQLMAHYKFSCDEFRSYTLQWLYLEIMPFFDNLIKEEQK